ncbi:uncharacterized protein LOC118647496 [Monomorium pharaonis]|uniref:uncharacterized protein LOC118647496 n=1 Tax=Monomorium pharaonis TaxID=307658 RepID=UPI001745D04B|nr:uncharacterized protein LOC118647496 [Monomorium pharaonis]
MHFLSSCLKGRAAECITNLPITAENFEIAWAALTSRYENKRRTLNIHLSALLGLPSVPRESASELQSLYDKITAALKSFSNLDRNTDNLWNDILVYLVTQKLDPITRKAWNLQESDRDDPPTYDALKRFFEHRIRALENNAIGAPVKPGAKTAPSDRVHAATASANVPPKCPLCNTPHYLNSCVKFREKNQRREMVKQQKRCFNCLSEKHTVMSCKSKFSCRVCKKRHHSLLHFDSDSSSIAPEAASPSCSSSVAPAEKPKVSSLTASTAPRRRSHVLLATAATPASKTPPISVTAVGGIHAGTFKHATQIFISPRNASTPAYSTDALILGSLTTYVPKRGLDISAFTHLSDLSWADPDPTSFDPISIIIGADLYSTLLFGGVCKGDVGQPIAQNSILGWIISGPINFPAARSPSHSSVQSSHASISTHQILCSPALEDELRRFWEVEELPRQSILSPQERQCETHFRETHSRDSDGRYVVRLPFKSPLPLDIGASRPQAERMLNTLTRRFKNNLALASEYRNFLAEYERLDHMRPAPQPQSETIQCVYIPHHGIIRENNATTSLRVVFNASSVTSNGSSLNDHLLAGPKLQTDITSILLQWRRYRFVYSSDIAKMYRQIRADQRDINYQRILWNATPHEPPTDYQLLTITYGMSCAPFLALRVLKQLVDDKGHRFPLSVSILRENIYIDDILFGADNAEFIRQARDQVSALLKCGGFDLRKWASNSPALLADLDPATLSSAGQKPFSPDEQIKVLGIGWNPTTDIFEFSVALSHPVPSSKRTILSAIAKLYDPLGWISRWCGLGSDVESAEIHDFADATAYAAAVYLKVVSSGHTTISLLVGKSKVAPLKPLSVPRLELSAALLLARLVNFVRESPGYSHLPYFCWTDSTIVLAWVTQHPSRWKTFVANRVNEIQSRLPNGKWQHVSTEDNPADCASRGLLGNEIVSHDLWWHGPSWLRLDAPAWPCSDAQLPPQAPLEKKVIALQ